MFCDNCDAQICDESEICEEYGSVRNHTPNYEYKTVRCYPSDNAERRYREFYEACGWTITDMDRRQFYEGQSKDGTEHYSTQTHIKMRRNKNIENYDKICELSAQAEDYFDTVPNKKAIKPLIGFFLATAIIGLAALLSGPYDLGILTFIGGIVLLIASAVFLTVIIIRIINNKKTKDKYYANKALADKALEECKALVEKSQQS